MPSPFWSPPYLTFAELPDDACRYETSGADVVADYKFCGLPAARGRPYCAEYWQLAHQVHLDDSDAFRRKPPVSMAA